MRNAGQSISDCAGEKGEGRQHGAVRENRSSSFISAKGTTLLGFASHFGRRNGERVGEISQYSVEKSWRMSFDQPRDPAANNPAGLVTMLK